MKADAVFEGGGVKGIAFVGAICKLEKEGYRWNKVAGTSAGSIIAALLAAGYSGEELNEIMMKNNYKELVDRNQFNYLHLLGNYLGIFINKGIYSGDNIQNWIQSLLERKGKTKFKHVFSDGEFKLKIIASDITKRDIFIIPDDLPQYNIDPMEFDIAKAVRMSISIPLFFTPVQIKCGKLVDYVVDGGITSNFPVWTFDVNGIPRWPTFGFKLKDKSVSFTSQGKKDLLSFILDTIGTVTDKKEERYTIERDQVRTMYIDTLGVKTTEFNLSKEKSNMLFKSGYAAASRFISTWDFSEYINKYRK